MRAHIDRLLIFRLSFFVLLFIIMMGLMCYDIYAGIIGAGLSLLGFFLGLGVGFGSQRVFQIKWHKKEKKVTSKIDKLGLAVLVPYLTFTISRHFIFQYWFKGQVLYAFTFSFVAGVMLGRVLAMSRSIKKILVERGLHQ